jgi:carbon-monoxide dehydrogenase iron sulfur subunit
MEKMLVVDHEKCTGCRLCEMVCSVKHTGMSNPSRSRIHVIKWPLEGFELPMLCQQCEEAPCIAVCPKDALFQDPILGRVALNYDLCIGCKMCVIACPFGGMGIDSAARQVIKCDLCDGDPTCVRFCDPGALQFVPASSVNLLKKRDAGRKLSEVMKKSFAARR